MCLDAFTVREYLAHIKENWYVTLALGHIISIFSFQLVRRDCIYKELAWLVGSSFSFFFFFAKGGGAIY